MKFDATIKKDFLEATGGNEDAWRFVELFCERCHFLDDVIDGDKEFTDVDLVQSELAMMLAFSTNPFWAKHGSFLIPLIIASYNAWLDSNEWAESKDPVKKCHSDVVKSFYHEVVFACVYLCGGWAKLREFTQKHREYQKDNYGTLRA